MGSNYTAELFQQYLDENAVLIEAIAEAQRIGKLDVAAQVSWVGLHLDCSVLLAGICSLRPLLTPCHFISLHPFVFISTR